MIDFHSPRAFILGCERSGSTWLSNVLDAHSGIEFFMEPFADYANLFPDFPCRNQYIEPDDDRLMQVVSEGYNNISVKKYLFFYSRRKSLRWKKVDRTIAKLYTCVSRWLKFSVPLRIQQFELLNLNAADIPYKWQVMKDEEPSLSVTKELRLNFKIGLMARTFPQAKYIIIVRHPGAQVASIMRLFSRGNLGELRRSLSSLYSHVHNCSRFDKYSGHYQCLDESSDLHEVLLLWWLINYETLIEDCKKFKVDFKIVYNEELSQNPEDEFQKIFLFLGLEYTQDIRDYITHSTTGTGTEVISPINTVRDSSKYSKESISNIDDEMKRCISNLYENFAICDELCRYRERE